MSAADAELPSQPPPILRWIVIGALAVWMFGLGAWLLSLDARPPSLEMRVAGPPVHAGPGPLELRVGAVRHGGKGGDSRPIAVTLAACEVREESGAASEMPCGRRDGTPAVATVTPGGAAAGRYKVRLEAAAGDSSWKLEVAFDLQELEALPVAREASGYLAIPPLGSAEQAGVKAEVFAAQGLASGLPIEAWVRVLGPGQAPLAATVTLQGQEATTDRFGLARLELNMPPMRGSTRLEVRPEDPALAPLSRDLTYAPRSRNFMVSVDLTAAGAPEIRRHGARATTYCDLYRGGVHAGATTFADARVEVPDVLPGLYALVCSANPRSGLEAHVPQALLVPARPGWEHLAALVGGLAQAWQGEAGWLARLPGLMSQAGAEESSRLASFLLSRGAGAEGVVETLYSSREAEQALRVGEVARRKAQLIALMLLTVLGVLGWATTVVLREYRRLKRAGASLAREEGFEGLGDLRRRSLPWQAALLVAMTLAAAVAFIWLMDLATRLL